MSKFDEAMRKPLPSKAHKDAASMLAAIEADLGITDGETVEESFDDIDTLSGAEPVSTEEEGEDMGDVGDAPEADENDPGDATEGGEEVGADDIDDIDDEFDPDDLDDEELKALDAELGGGDNGEEEHLTPEEEIKADDMMSIAATSLLVNDQLSGEEKKEFCQSDLETSIAVREGFMTEADINELAVECGLIEESAYTNKMIIRLDAASKKKQLYALAVNVSAAAHGDPDYYKLKKVMKMRKILRTKLDRKYHAEATKRMRVYFARLKKSKSKTLQNLSK